VADDEDQTPESEPSLDESAPEGAPTEATAGDARTDVAAEDPSPTTKTPWVAAGVGAVALLTIVLVALSYLLPAPRAAVPGAWTASASAYASARLSGVARAPSSGSASARPSSATPTTRATDGPTAFPTGTRCAAGQAITSGTWTAVVPTGWSCAAGVSGDTRGFQSASGDAISVGPSAAPDAVTACSSPFGGQAATVERFPDTTWGGRKAVTVNAQFSSLVVHYRCVDTPAGVYMMGGVVRSSAEDLVAGMDALAASWVWK
jgi:hypothetical protein